MLFHSRFHQLDNLAESCMYFNSIQSVLLSLTLFSNYFWIVWSTFSCASHCLCVLSHLVWILDVEFSIPWNQGCIFCSTFFLVSLFLYNFYHYHEKIWINDTLKVEEIFAAENVCCYLFCKNTHVSFCFCIFFPHIIWYFLLLVEV